LSTDNYENISKRIYYKYISGTIELSLHEGSTRFTKDLVSFKVDIISRKLYFYFKDAIWDN